MSANPVTPSPATDDIGITDAEWRQFQGIPDQGYSHRFWIDHLIAGRVADLTPVPDTTEKEN